jgi:hypothetical protein
VPELIATPTTIPVPGGKIIDEHVGRVNTGSEAVSIAHMKAPADWTEPFQAPAFDEYTLVPAVVVHEDGGQLRVEAGQSVLTRAGERIRYSTGAEGAEYIAVCLPAFSPDTVNRDEDDA